MRRARIIVPIFIVLAISPPASAQTVACETTAECGELRCIDGRCTDVPTALQRRLPTELGRVGMVTGGVGLIVAGLATLAGGVLLTIWSVTSHACDSNFFACDPPPYQLLAAAAPIDVIALVGIVGGSVMISFAAKHRPATTVSFAPTGMRVSW